MKIFAMIMYFAPIGFFAYFAATIGQLGPQLVHSYYQIAIYITSLPGFILWGV